jgi:zinc transporter 5/7
MFKTDVPSLPAVPLLSLLAIPLAAYSAQCERSSVEALVITTHHNLLSSASTLLATIAFGFMWFSRLPTTSEIFMGILFLYGQSQSFTANGPNPDPCRWIS